MMKLCLATIVIGLINSHPALLSGKKVRICEYKDDKQIIQKQVDISAECPPTLIIDLF